MTETWLQQARRKIAAALAASMDLPAPTTARPGGNRRSGAVTAAGRLVARQLFDGPRPVDVIEKAVSEVPAAQVRAILDRWTRSGWLTETDGGYQLTESGLAALGPTGEPTPPRPTPVRGVHPGTAKNRRAAAESHLDHHQQTVDVVLAAIGAGHCTTTGIARATGLPVSDVGRALASLYTVGRLDRERAPNLDGPGPGPFVYTDPSGG